MATQSVTKVLDAEAQMNQRLKDAAAKKEEMIACAETAAKQALSDALAQAEKEKERLQRENQHRTEEIQNGAALVTTEKIRTMRLQTEAKKESAVQACLDLLM